MEYAIWLGLESIFFSQNEVELELGCVFKNKSFTILIQILVAKNKN